MSGIVLKSAPSLSGAVQSVLAKIATVFAVIAAAGAAASAVDVRRQPSEADLKTLGLEGVRFKRYY